MSATTPTTVFHNGFSGDPSQQTIRLPIGLSVPNAARASVSLITMTSGACRMSASVNMRPAFSGNLQRLEIIRRSRSASRCWIRSRRERPALGHQAVGTTAADERRLRIEAATVTPGAACTPSSTGGSASRARSGDAVLRRGQGHRAVRTPLVLNPIGSCCRLIALRTSSAAPASTTITSAACAPISDCRIHGLSEPPSAPLPSPRSSLSDVRRVACHAGSSPTNTR